jgi:hypothetical protein
MPDVRPIDSPPMSECDAGEKKCGTGDAGVGSIVACDSTGHWNAQDCAQQTPVCCKASTACIAKTSCCTSAADVLTKPIASAELCARVRKLLPVP